jgi:hypothetical protein
MQRAGHVILDGVVDPDIWISYKVIFAAVKAGKPLILSARCRGLLSLIQRRHTPDSLVPAPWREEPVVNLLRLLEMALAGTT